ncbi:MAG: DNA-binding domain-containing protein [Paracoccaceae bacterium]|jgi:hypothetical protein|nr:DNA-binding domain-containing protein [Paracoccaceae bacterium]
MSVTQGAFRTALLDPGAPVPDGLTDPAGRPAGRRFDVYRNNVVASLAAALETGFPAVRALVGHDRFRALAIAHARAHPPRTPLMMHAGADLPAFLEAAGFGVALADVARLELAVRESYHAADAAPIDSTALGRVPPASLGGLRLRLAPALRLVASAHPVVSLRRAALEGDPEAEDCPETALVTRPGFDPVVTALAPAEGAFVAALAAGVPLGEAAARAAGHDPAFTPTAALSALLSGGAITSLEPEPAQ